MSVARADLEAAIYNLSNGMDKADLYDIIFSTLNTNDLITILNKLTRKIFVNNGTEEDVKAVVEEPITSTEPENIQESSVPKEPEQETVDITQFIKTGGLSKIQEIQERAEKYKNINLYELVNDVRMTDQDFQAVEELITKLRTL